MAKAQKEEPLWEKVEDAREASVAEAVEEEAEEDVVEAEAEVKVGDGEKKVVPYTDE